MRDPDNDDHVFREVHERDLSFRSLGHDYTAFAKLGTANGSVPDETASLPLSEANVRELDEPSSGDAFERRASFETSTTYTAMSAVQ